MLLKDYYAILELPPHATVPEIKKAYRRLVMIYHPDKTKNDNYANARFEEIKVAYETLTNPVKKQYYLQQRWYQQSTGERKFEKRPHTPFSVLNDCLQLSRYVAGLNDFRVDKEALLKHIHQIMNSETIEILNRFNETETNNKIISFIIEAAHPLNYTQTTDVAGVLKKISPVDPEIERKIDSAIKQKRNEWLYSRYELPIVFLIVIIICLLIWYSSK